MVDFNISQARDYPAIIIMTSGAIYARNSCMKFVFKRSYSSHVWKPRDEFIIVDLAADSFSSEILNPGEGSLS